MISQQQQQPQQLSQTQTHQDPNPNPLNVTFAPNSTHDYNPNLNIHDNDNEINLNPFDINNMMNNELWNFASGTTSNYVWPSGFTPEGQGQGQGSSTMNPNQEQLQFPQQQQQHRQMNPFQEPTIGQFMNTSPNTDMRLINALESGAAYIEGNPAEDEDIELFYYRFVSLCHRTKADMVVWSNSSPPWNQPYFPQTSKTKWLDSDCSTARIGC